jgi:hypothetical protein
MKKSLIIYSFFLTAFTINAQDQQTPEKFGGTLNLGAGIGYYGYVGHPIPVGTVNFEFDIAKNFTLAPFVGVYSYQNHYYWANPNKPYDDPNYYHEYSYRVIAAPIGLKGTYYFDQLFKASEKWDFYAAGSVGFVLRTVTWDNDYYGDRHVYQSGSPLYLDAHIGAEYHVNQKAGLFLDLSTGVSTVGLAIHF